MAGTLVFDVPAETVLTTVELHESRRSDGVRIALG
jgi:hypothetical protein